LVPGCCFSNSLPRVVKLSLSEAAAKTVTVPDSLGDADVEVSDLADESEEAEESSEEEQALSAIRAATPAPATCSIRRVRRAERVITIYTSVLSGKAVAPIHGHRSTAVRR
jgi:hypothetical protein